MTSILSSDSSEQPSETGVSAQLSTIRKNFLREGMIAVLVIAIAKLVLHCIFNFRYGYFRDEFDYLICGRHLAWGYVDQPPLIPFLTRLGQWLLGDSLRAIRFLPALWISAVVVLTAMMARQFGGRRFALVLSAIGILVAPIYLSDGSLLTTNCLEPLLWTGCAYFAVEAIQTGNSRYWLWFGIVAGIGLEEKYSIAFFCFAVAVGLILTKERRVFTDKWLWMGVAAAFLIFLPNLLWNIHHHWPFLELMHNIRASGRDVHLSAVRYIAQQIVLLHPVLAPIWITGLLAMLFASNMKPYRSLGWSYLVTLTVFIVLNGKHYYLAPIYPLLLASGAVTIEGAIERWHQRWLQPVIVVILVAAGAWIAPLVMPILSIDEFIAYMDKLPIKVSPSEHSHTSAMLPQYYADQFGWEEMVAVVNQAWLRVPSQDRTDCGIFAQNYGQAGAIDFLGSRYRLPPALSGHQTYFLWGPRSYSGNCLIVVGDKRARLEELYQQVEYVGTSDNPYALERNVQVFLCRHARFGSLKKFWPQLKVWD
jgi:Dolichyl-phosphate-mannose-protein mannosyltransferase